MYLPGVSQKDYIKAESVELKVKREEKVVSRGNRFDFLSLLV
jgi:hypothetical protein